MCPRAKRIHQSGDMKDLDRISCCRRTIFSVSQTYRNSSCGEQQQSGRYRESLSSRHTESLSSRNTESLSSRNTQHRGRPKRQKLSRNRSRMDDTRNLIRPGNKTGKRIEQVTRTFSNYSRPPKALKTLRKLNIPPKRAKNHCKL